MTDRTDEQNIVVDAAMFGIKLTEPTMHLRFIERGGKRILQQQWESKRWEHGVPTTWAAEWRDIPFVEKP